MYCFHYVTHLAWQHIEALCIFLYCLLETISRFSLQKALTICTTEKKFSWKLSTHFNLSGFFFPDLLICQRTNLFVSLLRRKKKIICFKLLLFQLWKIHLLLRRVKYMYIYNLIFEDCCIILKKTLCLEDCLSFALLVIKDTACPFSPCFI